MLDEIAKAIESLQHPMNRAEVNISIAQQFNLAHQSSRALLYIKLTLQEIALIPSEEEFVINDLECKVAEQLAKAGLQDRSTAMLTQAFQKADAFEDPDNRDYALISISEVYAEMGQYDRAIQIGLMIDDDFRRIWRLFDSIARTAILQHHPEQILNVLAAIDDSGDRDHFLLEAAHTYSVHASKLAPDFEFPLPPNLTIFLPR